MSEPIPHRELSKAQRWKLLSPRQIYEANDLDDETLLALHDLLHLIMETRSNAAVAAYLPKQEKK